MDNATNARRPEDIALDLLKFIVGTTNVVRTPSTPGFASATSARSDDHVAQLLDLYSRCRKAVESPAA